MPLRSVLYGYGLGRRLTELCVDVHFELKPCSIAVFVVAVKDAVNARYMLLSIWNQERRLDEITCQIISLVTFQKILESVVGNSNGTIIAKRAAC